jgi:hypothetical protein
MLRKLSYVLVGAIAGAVIIGGVAFVVAPAGASGGKVKTAPVPYEAEHPWTVHAPSSGLIGLSIPSGDRLVITDDAEQCSIGGLLNGADVVYTPPAAAIGVIDVPIDSGTIGNCTGYGSVFGYTVPLPAG